MNHYFFNMQIYLASVLQTFMQVEGEFLRDIPVWYSHTPQCHTGAVSFNGQSHLSSLEALEGSDASHIVLKARTAAVPKGAPCMIPSSNHTDNFT